MMRGRFGRLLVATALAVAGGVAHGASPASAAVCADGGVTAVVDFQSLGGGTRTACVPDGGGMDAKAIFAAAGYDVDEVDGSGFVCQVDEKPAECRPPNREYWSLWWSRGDGDWKYSTAGYTGLKIPDGGFVGWSWQAGSGRVAPGVTPSVPAPKPTPEPAPKPKPGKKATPTAARPSAPAPSPVGTTPPPSPTPSAAKPSTSSTGSVATTGPVDDPPPEAAGDDAVPAAASDDGDGGSGWLPVVAAVLVVALGASAAATHQRRKRHNGA